MDPRIGPLAEILRLNTRLFVNCLDGMNDEQASLRPSAATNNAGFVALHVADARYFLLGLLGAELANPFAALAGDARGIDDLGVLPPLGTIRTAWTAVADAVDHRLQQIAAAELDAPTASRFPVEPPTLLGALTFLVQHDSYHVGQLALLRKHAGLPAMGYD